MEKPQKNNKVLLGLSGGVDSTAAALLLSEKGYEVTGYYFDVTGKNAAGAREAAGLAQKLGVAFIAEDVSAEFAQAVVKPFCEEYVAGRTPNPCVICNPLVKFRKLLEIAGKIGADHIATGHYARVFRDEESGLFYPRIAANAAKDQSYMLYRLGQEALSRLIFPLGDFNDKEEIRQLARDFGLENAEKKDSQEICFLAEGEEHLDFIRDQGYEICPGDFTDSDGRVLGRHKGVAAYTVGQRKGLGLALGRPAYVTAIDAEQNRVVLGANDDLFKREVRAADCFFPGRPPEYFAGRKLRAKVRYAAKPAEASFSLEREETKPGVVDDKKIIAIFAESQRAPAPGQSLVFYDGDVVVGGGIIV